MKFECDDFNPLTFPNYGAAGCYGCANVEIGIEFVYCQKKHWCIPMVVPIMREGSDFFECSHRSGQHREDLSLCEDCLKFNTLTEKCDDGIKIREIVVRFD